MKERRLSYVYSFRCEDDLELFDKLPAAVQGSIERQIVNVICDSFVDPADEDYVSARLLAQKGMHRAFFWAASQALEKYLKAFLLMRGVAVDRFKGHPIGALHSEACSVDKQLATVDTRRHPSIKIHPNVSESIGEFSVASFIKGIEEHGSPDNRYNSSGVDFHSGYLFALDSYIFGLRNLIGVPSIEEAIRKMDQDLVEAFNAYNPWFVSTDLDLPEIPNEDFNLGISGAVTTLDILTDPNPPHGSRFVLHWLSRKMILPKKVRQRLKEV